MTAHPELLSLSDLYALCMSILVFLGVVLFSCELQFKPPFQQAVSIERCPFAAIWFLPTKRQEQEGGYGSEEDR